MVNQNNISSKKCELIIALDFKSTDIALQFVQQLNPNDCILKVGFELYIAAGPSLVKKLVSLGFRVFLDLKFHDIPNTVANACLRAAELGIWMMNVHASGGPKMMSMAKEALLQHNFDTHLIAVTVLTSMDQEQLNAINVDLSPEKQVQQLALLTNESGLDGVVCSAQEAVGLRAVIPSDFLLVTPGIRPTGSDNNDQTRIMTPQAAKEAGASQIVVGRPITQSNNPLAVIEQINRDIN